MVKNLNSDIQINTGRCEGGTFIQVVHIPTGISRYRRPLDGKDFRELQETFLAEIEQELISKNFAQYLA